MRKILVTGSSGKVGRTIAAGLERSGEYEVIGADIVPDPSASRFAFDVSELDQCCSLMQGVDTVIHLAYHMSPADMEEALKVNYLGTYNIYEAARLNGVRRVIFGSSNHTVGMYTPDEAVTPESAYKPDNLYAVSKCHAELLGQLYSEKFGISSINVRIGTFSVTPPKTLRQLRTWLSGEDAVELMRCCIEARDDIGYLVLYGVSGNRDKYWDIGYLEDLIGYKPKDDGSAHLQEDTIVDPQELMYQGGMSAFRKSI